MRDARSRARSRDDPTVDAFDDGATWPQLLGDLGALTQDAFIGGRLLVRQPRDGFRSGIDALIMAACVPAGDCGPRVLELGAGAGVASLALGLRLPNAVVHGLEIVPALADLAGDNAAHNALAPRVSFQACDLEGVGANSLLARLGPVDHVMMNPPYHAHGTVQRAANRLRAIANELGPAGLAPWIAAASRVLRPGGTLTIVNRPAAIPAVLHAMGDRFGAVQVVPFWSRAPEAGGDTTFTPDAAPNDATGVAPSAGPDAELVIIQASQARRGPFRLHRGMALHGPTGHGFTPALCAVLEGGAAIDLKGSR